MTWVGRKGNPRKTGKDALNIKHCDWNLNDEKFNAGPAGYGDIMKAGNIITVYDDGNNTCVVHSIDGGYLLV